ncbi:sensor histidine kinase [Actinorhabdospora filicis]|uniref:sensor histidine kinase n=1 Tax=Actinorhabdospora filicis TaxID=1785913 RepID=UPI002553FA4E|nr:sensor histidine kinase [Actinorhabdospora filicis]
MPHDRPLRRLAYTLALLCLPATAFVIWVDTGHPGGVGSEALSAPAWQDLGAGLPYVAAAAILATRLPRHPMTWLLMATGLSAYAVGVGSAYATLSLAGHGGHLPLTSAAIWAGGRIGPVINLSQLALLLYFPDGRLPGRRWRWPAGLALVAAVYVVGVLFTVPWRLLDPGGAVPEALRPDPFALPLPDAYWVSTKGFPLIFVSVYGFVLATFVRRFFGADAEKRAQLRWMLLAGCVLFALILGDRIAPPGLVYGLVSYLASMAVVAVAVLIAVSRYRLYDVDILLGRTLLYGLLTVLVVGVDITVFVSVGAFLDDPVAAVAGAGVVAVLYGPLRLRVQRGVNRVLTGRGEPYDLIAALAVRLEESTDPRELLREVARVVGRSFRASYVKVEVDGGQSAAWGEPADSALDLPFAYRGVHIGRLLIAPRPGTRLGDADQRLLADLVRQAAAAVRNTALTEELQAGRERLVTGIAEERRRLRRDLHDGLGPALAAAGLKAEAARNLAARDPARAGRILDELRGDLTGALADLRRAVHDLRPPVLDQYGLATALRRQAEAFDGPRLRVAVEAGETGDLPAAVEEAVYRIAGEALSNVVRHAAASECVLRLEVTGDTVALDVADDGAGLADGTGYGVGLIGMRERAAELGGELTVASGASGTTVRARIPRRRNDMEGTR